MLTQYHVTENSAGEMQCEKGVVPTWKKRQCGLSMLMEVGQVLTGKGSGTENQAPSQNILPICLQEPPPFCSSLGSQLLGVASLNAL